jgi:hypothetical protein
VVTSTLIGQDSLGYRRSTRIEPLLMLIVSAEHDRPSVLDVETMQVRDDLDD